MPGDYLSEAIDLFGGGFNCSQAVLAVFCEEHGLDAGTALRISGPFGGGMGDQGLTCGALTGAMMVIGLKYGYTNPADGEMKRQIQEKVGLLTAYFKDAHAAINCHELLDFNIKELSSSELALRGPGLQSGCQKYLETVIAFLEEEL